MSFGLLLLDHLERVPDIQMLSFIFKWSFLLAYQVMPLVGVGLTDLTKRGGEGRCPLCSLIVYGSEIVFVIVFGTYNSNHQYGFALTGHLSHYDSGHQ